MIPTVPSPSSYVDLGKKPEEKHAKEFKELELQIKRIGIAEGLSRSFIQFAKDQASNLDDVNSIFCFIKLVSDLKCFSNKESVIKFFEKGYHCQINPSQLARYLESANTSEAQDLNNLIQELSSRQDPYPCRRLLIDFLEWLDESSLVCALNILPLLLQEREWGWTPGDLFVALPKALASEKKEPCHLSNTVVCSVADIIERRSKSSLARSEIEKRMAPFRSCSFSPSYFPHTLLINLNGKQIETHFHTKDHLGDYKKVTDAIPNFLAQYKNVPFYEELEVFIETIIKRTRNKEELLSALRFVKSITERKNPETAKKALEVYAKGFFLEFPLSAVQSLCKFVGATCTSQSQFIDCKSLIESALKNFSESTLIQFLDALPYLFQQDKEKNAFLSRLVELVHVEKNEKNKETLRRLLFDQYSILDYLEENFEPGLYLMRNDGSDSRLEALRLVEWVYLSDPSSPYVILSLPEKEFCMDHYPEDYCHLSETSIRVRELCGETLTQALQSLITSYLYEAKRSKKPSCFEVSLEASIRTILKSPLLKQEKDYPLFQGIDLENLKGLETLLRELESKNGFFSEYPSDEDSDDEGIRTFESYERPIKRSLLQISSSMLERAQLDILLKKGNKVRTKTDFKGLKTRELSLIYADRKEPSFEVQDCISEINHHGLTNLSKIAEPLYVAFYRGIHYDIKNWGKETRKAHRNFNEIGHPLFSRAVYDLCGLDPTRDYAFTADSSRLTALEHKAILLRHQMLSLKKMGAMRWDQLHGSKLKDLVSRKTQSYNNPLDFVSEFYSSRYENFHKALAIISSGIKKGEVFEHPVDIAFLFARSKENPVVSTGGTPEHALRYADGRKVYNEDQERTRLQPRWRESAKPERPYAGKIYTILMRLESYRELQPIRVSSLQTSGQITVPETTAPEDEATFLGYIPGEFVIHQKKIRFPSFERPYSAHFLQKYGLETSHYEEYKNKLTKHLPHSKIHDSAKITLATHLSNYRQLHLIQDARLNAEEKGGSLIYLDRFDQVSTIPPKIRPLSAVSKNVEKNEAQTNMRGITRAQKEERQNLEPNGWLCDLVKEFKVLTGPTLPNILQKMGVKWKGKPNYQNPIDIKQFFQETLEPAVENYFSEQYCFLKYISQKQSFAFTIKSPLFKQDIHIGPHGGERVWLVYLGGFGLFGLIRKSTELAQKKLKLEQEK